MPFNTRIFKIVRSRDSTFKENYLSFLEIYSQYIYQYNLSSFDYHESTSNSSVDHSFLLVSEDNAFAFCPLVFEKIDNRYQGSMGNGIVYLASPVFSEKLSKRQKRRAEKEVYEEFKRICFELDVDRVIIQTESISMGFNNLEDNLFSRNGSLEISGYHNIVDLTVAEDKIWEHQIRHSYKSIINRGYKHYTFRVYDQTNYNVEIGERHRLLHHKCAGRVTRPLISFDKMYSWIKQNNGLMFEQLYNNRTVQMIMVSIGKYSANGASAADEPDITVPCPLTHSMNHYIFLECKKRGIKYYDVGETTNRGSMFYMPIKKVLDINYFKSGFGRKYPLKRWIWFPSKEKETDYLEEQLLKYKDYLKEEFSGSKS